jgi:hypothetical protein
MSVSPGEKGGAAIGVERGYRDAQGFCGLHGETLLETFILNEKRRGRERLTG